jgi:hypothetical protein
MQQLRQGKKAAAALALLGSSGYGEDSKDWARHLGLQWHDEAVVIEEEQICVIVGLWVIQIRETSRSGDLDYP